MQQKERCGETETVTETDLIVVTGGYFTVILYDYKIFSKKGLYVCVTRLPSFDVVVKS